MRIFVGFVMNIDVTVVRPASVQFSWGDGARVDEDSEVDLMEDNIEVAIELEVSSTSE